MDDLILQLCFAMFNSVQLTTDDIHQSDDHRKEYENYVIEHHRDSIEGPKKCDKQRFPAKHNIFSSV